MGTPPPAGGKIENKLKLGSLRTEGFRSDVDVISARTRAEL
jgi:hypothetical protein